MHADTSSDEVNIEIVLGTRRPGLRALGQLLFDVVTTLPGHLGGPYDVRLTINGRVVWCISFGRDLDAASAYADDLRQRLAANGLANLLAELGTRA